ncbi:thiamine pyrophosphate-binding protein [Micromonospora sp. NPDC051296]|uniref:thiamine pyrophosphate-binding protein n=1 Tax=Micromonospora sp. NPDC051296 TaxID=3155046 RepID=UPI0034399989
MPDPTVPDPTVPDPAVVGPAVPESAVVGPMVLDPAEEGRAVAEALVARLSAWRVSRVFGRPGEANAAVVEALRAAGGDPEFVPARHGETAAFMATGHARFTGGIGVCLAAEGPAAFGLLSGLAGARQAGLPVLAIVGVQPPDPSTVPHPSSRLHPSLAPHSSGGPRPASGPRPATGPHRLADSQPSGPYPAKDGSASADSYSRIGRLFAGSCRHVRYAGDPHRVADLVDEALRSAVTTGGPVCLVLPHHGHGDRHPFISADGPIDPALVLDELAARLPQRIAVTVDGDKVLTRLGRHLPRGAVVLPCDAPGATGGSLPYAMAAKLADPDRPVLALVTDEGMQLHGLAELVTVARGWWAWPDPRLVILVLNTRSGHRRYPGSARTMADDVPYAGWARLLGLHGVRVDRPELVGAAWDEALAADRPCVLEIVVGPTRHPAAPGPRDNLAALGPAPDLAT